MKRFSYLVLSAVLVLSLVGCSSSAETETPTTDTPITYADTVAWDYEYDVVVAGFGAAGSVASKTAAENGAKVLLVEKMAQGLEGGNSKVCGQLFAYGNGDEESTRTYYKNLAGELALPEDVLDTLVQGIAHMREIMNEEFDVPMEDFMDWSEVPTIGEMSPEYPWLEGSDVIGLWTTHAGLGDGYLYNIFQEHVFENSDSIDIWYESPAVSLIQDPVSNTVIGVEVSRGGESLNIRALNGVVLATGGFESNEEMVADYLGLGDYAVIGGQYNTGDGIIMAMEAGADLWHMEAYEGGFFNTGLSLDVEMGTPAAQFALSNGSAITVGAGGKRYIPEEIFAKHGHVPNNGSWANPKFPLDSYVVWDQKYMDMMDETGLIPEAFKDAVVSGNTIEELANNAGIDATGLSVTVNNFNTYANNGFDPEFNRSAESMTAFDAQGPYYAVYVKPSILNTQGGPRKNGEAEVLDTRGEVIPNLYVAGEMGGVTSYQYQGGTNIGECITFGRKAGANAAIEKPALPAYTIETVVSEPILAGVESDYAPFEIELEENQYLGKGDGIGGTLYVVVTMDESTIVSVEVVSHSETDGVSDPAFESVPSAIVDAQSTEVDTVSGATITSKAIITAVNDALSQVK